MLDEKADVKRSYDRWALSYDADRNITRDFDALIVRRSPLDLQDRDVLEVGCGTGKNTVWLAKHARKVIAMDFSEGMIARARQRIVTSNVDKCQRSWRRPGFHSCYSCDSLAPEPDLLDSYQEK